MTKLFDITVNNFDAKKPFRYSRCKMQISQGSHLDWKTLKMGRHFPVRENSGNFEQTGKTRENQNKCCF